MLLFFFLSSSSNFLKMPSKGIVQEKVLKKITGIEFGVFNGGDAKQLAVLELHERNIYDVSGPTRVPAPFGVLDSHLGPIKGELCSTCGESIKVCVGHFGFVRLVLPVFHVGYFKLVIQILQNICKVFTLLISRIVRVFSLTSPSEDLS